MSSTVHTLQRDPGSNVRQPRAIAHRVQGRPGGGPITRLMSPGDLGQWLKPFVFLDRFEGDGRSAPPLDTGWHPHSGIATVTVVLDGCTRYAETTGRTGVVPAGGVEWMRAGGGVWHTGTGEPGVVRGFQLWVALPPALELAPSESHHVQPDQVPAVGPARVVLGTYQGHTSPIPAPPMTCLAVSLRDGERWTFEPPADHDVAWVALMDGALHTPERIADQALAVFEPARQAGDRIDVVAEGNTRFVLGSAPRHPHPLVLGPYSVHTSRAALAQGEEQIRRIGRGLRAEGKHSHALHALVQATAAPATSTGDHP